MESIINPVQEEVALSPSEERRVGVKVTNESVYMDGIIAIYEDSPHHDSLKFLVKDGEVQNYRGVEFNARKQLQSLGFSEGDTERILAEVNRQIREIE